MEIVNRKKGANKGSAARMIIFLIINVFIAVVLLSIFSTLNEFASSTYAGYTAVAATATAMMCALLLASSRGRFSAKSAGIRIYMMCGVVAAIALTMMGSSGDGGNIIYSMTNYICGVLAGALSGIAVETANILTGSHVKRRTACIAMIGMLVLSMLSIVSSAYFVVHWIRLAIFAASYFAVFARALRCGSADILIPAAGMAALLSCDVLRLIAMSDMNWIPQNAAEMLSVTGAALCLLSMACFVTLRAAKDIKQFQRYEALARTAKDEKESLDREWRARADALTDETVRLEKELAECRESHKQFVRDISHEFRIPISIIKGYGDTLLAGLFNDEDTRMVYIRKICMKAELMNKLITNLIASSRQNESDQLKKSLSDINRIINDVVYDYTLQAGSLGIRINLMLPPKSVFINLDEARMSQSISNIVENSLKYMGRQGTITVTAGDAEKGSYMIVIRDDGLGIAQKEADIIFDKNFRGENKERASGNGLGLYFTKETVELHGGKIWAKGELDRGMSTYIILPTKN